MAKRTFRQNYIFPVNASHSWFPGHMRKGLGQIHRKMANVDCVLEVHDARIPISGRNYTFKDTVRGSRPHLLLLNKADLFPDHEKENIRRKLKKSSPHISEVLFTNCKMLDCPGTNAIIPLISDLIGQNKRSNQFYQPDSTVLVVGIPNVGKSSMINRLRSTHLRVRGKPASVAPKPGWTKSVGERIRVCDSPLIYLLDSPGISLPFIKDMHTGMKLAVCATLKDQLVGEEYIADYLLYWLNKSCNFSYVEEMGLEEPEDSGPIMLAKSAIANNSFIRVKDISKGSGQKVIPNQKQMALKFLKLFRSGKFGQVNLDYDLFEDVDLDKLKNLSKGARIY